MKSRIAVVTIVKNDANGLNRTLTSMMEQDFHDFVCIIVMGESNDLTESVAAKFCEIDPRFRKMYESDKGIYNAMNDGIKSTESDFICFMNSGDIFVNELAMSKMYQEIFESKSDVVIGNFYVDNEDRLRKNWNRRVITNRDFAFNRNWGNHQSMLFRRPNEPLYFDIRYTIAADFKYVLQYLKSRTGLLIPDAIARISSGGVSDKKLIQGYLEKFAIRNEIFNQISIRALNVLWTLLAVSKRMLRNTSMLITRRNKF
jgi:glycosyltransferase involved in cell wall biosynthesis